jgi:hypothetical protein
MALYALITNGVVEGIADLADGYDPVKTYPSYTPVACSATVQPGYLYEGGAFSPPPAPTLTQSQLAALLVGAARAACSFVTQQIVPDQTHQNAYINAAAMVGPSGAVPTVAPTSTSFTALASAFGMQPQAFATLVVSVAAASMNLSATLAALQAAAQTATTAAQLATALASFETAINDVVAGLNSVGLTMTVTEPSAITIAGINA